MCLTRQCSGEKKYFFLLTSINCNKINSYASDIFILFFFFLLCLKIKTRILRQDDLNTTL